MFTGIVETTGTVVETSDDEGGRRLRIEVDEAGATEHTASEGAQAAPEPGGVDDSDGGVSYDDLHHGQSIAVNGVCLTVEAFRTDPSPQFEVFLASETVEKTYLGAVEAGDRVNLERALAADGRFDGHLVQGHVDTTTEVTAVERVGDDSEVALGVDCRPVHPDARAVELPERGGAGSEQHDEVLQRFRRRSCGEHRPQGQD